MAGRASIVGAAATHVGKVREHNEDAHFLDVEQGMFLVCDGMGGHAAGEVASDLAIRSIQHQWSGRALSDAAAHWLERGTADAKKQLLDVVRGGVHAAHAAILAEAERDATKSGMGTTLVGGIVVGGEAVFAHAGDSRAYLVRDGISMQLTEDHTLLARLLAAGIDVDVSGEGSRFRSMLTNALGIGDEVKVSTFVVPLADGDRFLLCSDGVSEYVPENEVGEVLTKQPSPARAAQRLIELALERGGGDNATVVVVRVLEAGENPQPAEQRKRDDAAIAACALWGKKMSPQQRLRALRIAIPRDHAAGDKLPARALGDRVAWIIVEGALVQDGVTLGPGALVYPESLVMTGEPAPPPDRDGFAVAHSEVRALAIRADDFRELCDDDSELGDALLAALTQVIATRKARLASPPPVVDNTALPFGRAASPSSAGLVDGRAHTDPQVRAVDPRRVPEAFLSTDPGMPAVSEDTLDTVDDDLEISIERPGDRHDRHDRHASERAATGQNRGWPQAESAIIAPVGPRPAPPQAPARPSPPPPGMVKRPPAPQRAAVPAPAAKPSRSDAAPTPTLKGLPATKPPAAQVARSQPPASPAAPKGFARPLAPPTVAPGAPAGKRESLARPPTEPEITFELEADEPPARSAALPTFASGDVPLGFGTPTQLRTPAKAAKPKRPKPELRDPDDEHELFSITFEGDHERVTETVTVSESDDQVLTITVTESSDADASDARPVTAADAPVVSGTIPPDAQRRAKRHSQT